MTKQNRKVAIPAPAGAFEDAIEVAFREESTVAAETELFCAGQRVVRRDSWAGVARGAGVVGGSLYQGVRRARPLARRCLMTRRPAFVAMRARKPWVRARLRLLGWNVRFMSVSWLGRHSGAFVERPLLKRAGKNSVEPVPSQ